MLEQIKDLLRENFDYLKECFSNREHMGSNRIPSENEQMFLQAIKNAGLNFPKDETSKKIVLLLLSKRDLIFATQNTSRICREISSTLPLRNIKSAETIINGLDHAIALYHHCCINFPVFTLQEQSKPTYANLFQLYQDQKQQDNPTFASQTPYPESEPFLLEHNLLVNTVEVVEETGCCCRPSL